MPRHNQSQRAKQLAAREKSLADRYGLLDEAGKVLKQQLADIRAQLDALPRVVDAPADSGVVIRGDVYDVAYSKVPDNVDVTDKATVFDVLGQARFLKLCSIGAAAVRPFFDDDQFARVTVTTAGTRRCTPKARVTRHDAVRAAVDAVLAGVADAHQNPVR